MRIISGGQTGVDRAALDAAMEFGIPHGGCICKGRRAEDGPLPARYQMRELPSPDYADRSKANVDWADATLILYRGRMSGGTLFTWEYARNRGKPTLLIDLASEPSAQAITKVREWLSELHPAVLNIAGPRESTAPGIYSEAKAITQLFLGVADKNPDDFRP